MFAPYRVTCLCPRRSAILESRRSSGRIKGVHYLLLNIQEVVVLEARQLDEFRRPDWADF